MFSLLKMRHALVSPLFLLVAALLVDGHGMPPARPLKRMAHPSTLALEILPRSSSISSSTGSHTIRRSSLESSDDTSLRHSDSFRLTLTAFDTTFHLHLFPNDELVHPDARIKYYTVDPLTGLTKIETVPLLREDVRAYWGHVIHPEYSEERMREDVAGKVHMDEQGKVLGWARIMVHEFDGDDDEGRVGAGKASSRHPPIYEGAFSFDGITHHISTLENYLRHKHPLDAELPTPLEEIDGGLVIWRDSDQFDVSDSETRTGSGRETGTTCAHDTLAYNTNPRQNPILRPPPVIPTWNILDPALFGSSFDKRDDVAGNGMTSNFAGSIGNTDGCPKSQQLLYMGVAADCKYVTQYGSRDSATKQILNDWNTVGVLYKTTFNVSLGIVEMQVMDTTCPSTPDPTVPWNVDCTTTLNDRLSLFSQWRGNKGADNAGLWHLMSGCPTGTEVGIAWLATLCQQTSSGAPGSIVSGTAVSTSGRTEWQVVAHEIGHNFGAIHDCASGCNSTTVCCPLTTSSCDASSAFLMSPVAQASEKVFSACTVGNVCSLMAGTSGGQTNTTCLVDPSTSSVQTITLQMCGNGIVEPGEDCDPGSGLQSSCCDSSTCKFTPGSVCDPLSSACCTSQCDFAPRGQICRPSKDAQCDQPEMCTGTTATCPADVMAANGKSCGAGDLACASGQCTSVSKQCATVGASMGLKEECPNRSDNTCQISCQDPTRSNQCILLSSLLIDGSPCGYGGMCSQGKCMTGSLFDTAKAWYTQNLQIAIPVTVVAGLVAIILLWFIIRGILRCIRGRDPALRGSPRPLTLDPAMASARHERLTSFDDRVPGAGINRANSSGGGNRAGFGAGGVNRADSRGNRFDNRGGAPEMRVENGRPVSNVWDPRAPRARTAVQGWVDETQINGPRRLS
ncbi:Metallo-peptidase family M12-domain-containing protein [Mycena floridula]|nr:Metallo-peptidase family M12-domain-containing protein [Mycena floridula]